MDETQYNLRKNHVISSCSFLVNILMNRCENRGRITSLCLHQDSLALATNQGQIIVWNQLLSLYANTKSNAKQRSKSKQTSQPLPFGQVQIQFPSDDVMSYQMDPPVNLPVVMKDVRVVLTASEAEFTKQAGNGGDGVKTGPSDYRESWYEDDMMI